MRAQRRFSELFVLAVAFTALVLAGCGVSSATSTPGSSATSTPSSSGTPTAIIKVATTTVGGSAHTMLTDNNGMSLYYFDPDTATTAACTSSCTQEWPPLLLTSGTPASATALSGQLTAAHNANGRQVLYNGHPLYDFSGDTKPGDTNGDGVGGKWHLATPDTATVAATAPTVGPTDTPNPYNY